MSEDSRQQVAWYEDDYDARLERMEDRVQDMFYKLLADGALTQSHDWKVLVRMAGEMVSAIDREAKKRVSHENL